MVTSTRKPQRRRQLEQAEGRALVQLVAGAWWAPLLHHSPNEEMNSTARQIAAGQGTRPGFPDYVLFLPARHYYGAAIELKAPKPYGKAPSEAQRWWLHQLDQSGFFVSVAFGAEHALELLQSYAKHARRRPVLTHYTRRKENGEENKAARAAEVDDAG